MILNLVPEIKAVNHLIKAKNNYIFFKRIHTHSIFDFIFENTVQLSYKMLILTELIIFVI